MSSLNSKRVRVAVLFGSRSVEHEISVITALQLMAAIDPARYEVVPVYIAPNGSWYTGDALFERAFYRGVPDSLAKLQEVTLLPKPGIGGLTKIGGAVDVAKDALSISPLVIPIDIFVPVFHGQFGEDGCIQGLFELANVPYTGSNVPSSAITMNKYLCKMYLKEHGIPVLPALLVSRRDAREALDKTIESITAQQGFSTLPLFVKPCNLGSSIGVSRVTTREQLAPALAKVFRYDTAALIEPCVSQIMEINVSIRDFNGTQASVVEIPVSDSGVLSYEEKYLRGGGKKTGESQSQGMASLTRVIDPVDLDPSLRSQVIEYGKRAFSLLGCSGVARLDFIVDLATEKLYFNELNAFPGSCAFYLWARSNPRVLYPDLIDQMIQTGLRTFADQASLDRSIGLKALKQ
ncbi:MAG: D-alanine--D-alanine ligase family protein [Pseudomonadota bacterium]|jgi:D-alanine-D-alanine ligase